MNQKIEQFAKEAGLQCSKDEALCFAELIVKECAAFLRLGGGKDGYEEGERLKRHFGVQE